MSTLTFTLVFWGRGWSKSLLSSCLVTSRLSSSCPNSAEWHLTLKATVPWLGHWCGRGYQRKLSVTLTLIPTTKPGSLVTLHNKLLYPPESPYPQRVALRSSTIPCEGTWHEGRAQMLVFILPSSWKAGAGRLLILECNLRSRSVPRAPGEEGFPHVDRGWQECSIESTLSYPTAVSLGHHSWLQV